MPAISRSSKVGFAHARWTRWCFRGGHLYTKRPNLRHSSVETQSIVVLDFGAQYSQLIARRIREQKIFSVVLPFNASLEEIRSYSPVGIILSTGPSSVYAKHPPPPANT